MSPLEPFRWIVGQGVLLYEKLTLPTAQIRSADEQSQIDQQTSNMAIYEYGMCPFCMKLRKEMHRKSLNVELRDARWDEKWRSELIEQGGKAQVPCLRLEHEDGTVQWMYESSDIIAFLNQRFPDPA